MRASLVAALSALVLLVALVAPASASGAATRTPAHRAFAAPALPSSAWFPWRLLPGALRLPAFPLGPRPPRPCHNGVRPLRGGGAIVCASSPRRPGYATPF